MLNDEVVLTRSNGQKQNISILVNLRKSDMDFVDSVCSERGHFRQKIFQTKPPHPHLQTKMKENFLAKTLKPVEKAMNGFFTSKFVHSVKTSITEGFN